jgi:hypothetical protein
MTSAIGCARCRTIEAFRQALLDAGYPPVAIPEIGFEFESEETVRRDYRGNWFHRMK